MQKPERFSALGHRDFRLFLIGQTVSLSGTWMQSVAQGWLVYSLTRSPFYLGMVAAAGAFPILFFTLIGGVIADRFAKRNLLLLTQALSIIPALLLGILTLAGVIAVWQVALLAFVLGTINAVDIPARQSFLIEMVGRGHVVNAIAMNSAVFNGSRIIGPMIAGLSIEYFGMPACFFINAASFAAVIVALLMMEARGETRAKSEGVLRDLMRGIAFIRGNKGIQSAFLLIGVFSLVGLPYISLLPVFAGEIFHRGAQGLGFLMGASGVGALAAALGIAARGTIRDNIKFMSLAALCFSCALLAFSVSRTFWVSLCVMAAGGWGLVSYLAAANSYIQLKVPDELRGRVMSVYSFVFLGLVPVGNSVMGTFADRAGTTTAVASGAMVCIIASFIYSWKYLFRARGTVEAGHAE
jgi:MFS family permease